MFMFMKMWLATRSKCHHHRLRILKNKGHMTIFSWDRPIK